MGQLDDIYEAFVPFTTFDAAEILFSVNCVEQVAVKSFQLGHGGFIKDIVYPLAKDSSLIFFAFNLNEGMDRNIKGIGHIEGHFKRGTLL